MNKGRSKCLEVGTAQAGETGGTVAAVLGMALLTIVLFLPVRHLKVAGCHPGHLMQVLTWIQAGHEPGQRTLKRGETQRQSEEQG